METGNLPEVFWPHSSMIRWTYLPSARQSGNRSTCQSIPCPTHTYRTAWLEWIGIGPCAGVEACPPLPTGYPIVWLNLARRGSRAAARQRATWNYRLFSWFSFLVGGMSWSGRFILYAANLEVATAKMQGEIRSKLRYQSTESRAFGKTGQIKKEGCTRTFGLEQGKTVNGPEDWKQYPSNQSLSIRNEGQKWNNLERLFGYKETQNERRAETSKDPSFQEVSLERNFCIGKNSYKLIFSHNPILKKMQKTT